MTRQSVHRMGLALALLLGGSVQAAIFTVGNGAGCTHGTIQSAINAAHSVAGADTVRLTRSLTYEPEANTINTGQELTIEGGYATCDQVNPDTTNTIVSGAGGTHAPVFTITAPTGALIRLRRLTISGGDVDASGVGGGIRFEGDGILDIENSSITQNTAGFGGGIYARGTGSNAELVIGPKVLIAGNTARYDGGGIYSSELEMSMTAPGSALFNNKAIGVSSSSYTGGYGGGLYLHAGDRDSYAYIGSGLAGIGAIAQNSARYGGGVALGGKSSDDSSSRLELWMFTTDPARPARIGSNSASINGGAFHGRSFKGMFDGSVLSNVKLWNVLIEDNRAPDGAVAYLGGDEPTLGYAVSARLEFNTSALPPGAVPCAVGAACGVIRGNVAADINGGLTDGAIIRGETSSVVNLGAIAGGDGAPPHAGVIINGNQGGRLYYDGGEMGSFHVGNVLIHGNQFSQEMIRLSDRGLVVADSTIADNSISAGHLFTTFNAEVIVRRALLWQPGVTILSRSGGTMAVDHVMASEINSIGGNFGGGGDCGGGACAILANPYFVDPQHGDYSLRAHSPAIDMAQAIPGDDRDLSGRPRDQDLPHTFSDNGVRDLGAFERPTLQPLVLNGDFDFQDLRLWTHWIGEWDGTQNASGAGGSGSWSMHTSGLTYRDVNVGEQCIPLPGPGRYSMTGWGKGGGNSVLSRDYAILKWEYRRTSDIDCSTATVDASGELTLGSGADWQQPAHPVTLDAPEADFITSSPSIKLLLIARDGSPLSIGGPISAWFDGIAVSVESRDVIFTDGFD